MDEPTASLDFGNQAVVLRQVRRLRESGLGIVLSTHDPDHAFACATAVALLHQGGLLAIGPPDGRADPGAPRRRLRRAGHGRSVARRPHRLRTGSRRRRAEPSGNCLAHRRFASQRHRGQAKGMTIMAHDDHARRSWPCRQRGASMTTARARSAPLRGRRLWRRAAAASRRRSPGRPRRLLGPRPSRHRLRARRAPRLQPRGLRCQRPWRRRATDAATAAASADRRGRPWRPGLRLAARLRPGASGRSFAGNGAAASAMAVATGAGPATATARAASAGSSSGRPTRFPLGSATVTPSGGASRTTGAAGPKGYKRSDQRIQEDVNDRLADDPYSTRPKSR